MKIVKVQLDCFKISMEYLTSVAGEFCGQLLQATPGEQALEFGFEGINEDRHAKLFLNAIDSSFRIKPDKPYDN